MMNNPPATSNTLPKLLLTAREAAETLSVCEKTLWSMTTPRGDLACVRIGRSVRYRPSDLDEFLEHRTVGDSS